ncbi:MAG: amino acid permease [Deltaproteobacteria bacterium]|nr:amino acid permease [Deltaproteobacteria bacterium]
MKNGIFTIKPVTRLRREAEHGEGLRRALGSFELMSLGVGAIIGAGIFVLTGHAAAQHAGPAIVLSFILSGIACAFAGLCYAEMAAMIPVAGSAYTYAYATLGELFAWIIGWDLILEYLFGAVTVAIGWSGYVVSFLRDFGIVFPPALSAAPGKAVQLADGSHITAIFNLPAALIIFAVTALLIIGVKESAYVNNIIVIIKLAILTLFILAGVGYVHPSNWSPFIPPNTGNFGEFGLSGILRGAGVIFFAYIGFDAVSTAAQEARNPQQDMPIGILGSLGICTILYIIVALVLTGIVPYPQLNVPDPVAVGVDATGMLWLAPIVKIGAIGGLSSVILVMLLSQPRIFWSMSRDGLLPQLFAQVHPRFRTPHVTIIVTGLVAALLAAVLPIDIVGELVSIGTLLAFVIVCAGVIVLRRTQPDAPRPFRCPGVPTVPILGILTCMSQMVSLPLDTWIRLVVWMAIGMIIYFAYSRHHSRLQQETT